MALPIDTNLRAFGEKVANSFVSDYLYHANQLYNPESYGFDVRTPTGRDDIRNIAVATGVGTLIGGVRGAIWPGYVEKLDDHGRVISKKKRSRLVGSLRDAAASGATSAISSAAGITAKKYLPEIENTLGNVKERITNMIPIWTRQRSGNVDVNQALLDRIQATV